MGNSMMILSAILVPIFFGLGILIKPEFKNRNTLLTVSGAGLIITALLACFVIFSGEMELMLFSFGKNLHVFFHVDGVSRVFAAAIAVVWVLAGFYAFEYMKHEKEEKRYFGFYLMEFGVLLALAFSGNMVTYYFFYEMMTLFSVPLILHSRTKEAIMAGLKYMFYSLFGAYMVLFGIYFLNKYAVTLNFSAGGVLNLNATAGKEGFLLIVAFCMILGFGVKAGMFPVHGWLPTAHPIAPAPASAVMSGIIVKMGVLGMIRVVYYLFGAEFIRGTWVQTAWMTLALVTVFMGSMLAYREKVLKKRLAYSTVSQVSYILFGMALLQPEGLTGSLLHVVFHAVIKSLLFLCAGVIIYKTGKTTVDELKGIGKEMPVTIWCYTFAAAALIGFPPFSGFISKWHLAVGSLESAIPVFSWVGPVILLVSALLTAGYLLPITVNGFLPGAEYDYSRLKKKEPVKMMLIPLMILAFLTIILGVFPNPLTDFISNIVNVVL
ncbi:MAG: proton-conducting transporter membrane subunit [Ruminococcus sp.]|nr:proton-conducting transporter membrane subunit [Ruminococcus sp.]